MYQDIILKFVYSKQLEVEPHTNAIYNIFEKTISPDSYCLGIFFRQNFSEIKKILSGSKTQKKLKKLWKLLSTNEMSERVRP